VTADDNAANATAASVGTWLRVAREAAGLSQDAVAQQLKLAPRQVRAIEDDDYGRLPGRTFVRGFVRNYARLVNLDPEAVVEALPSGEPTSPLERLTYTPSSRPMGELPVESSRRSGRTTRWLIPLLLLAIVAVAAYYEFSRQAAPRPALPDGIMPPPTQPAPPAAPGGTQLPNPLQAPKADASPPPQSTPATSGAADLTPATVVAAVVPTPLTMATGAPADATTATPATAAPAAANATAAPSAATPVADTPLVLTFTRASWVQIKDAAGTAVVSQTAPAGATIPVGGALPLDVVLGNAEHVNATLRGQPLDLVPYTRLNVARFTVR